MKHEQEDKRDDTRHGQLSNLDAHRRYKHPCLARARGRGDFLAALSE